MPLDVRSDAFRHEPRKAAPLCGETAQGRGRNLRQAGLATQTVTISPSARPCALINPLPVLRQHWGRHSRAVKDHEIAQAPMRGVPDPATKTLQCVRAHEPCRSVPRPCTSKLAQCRNGRNGTILPDLPVPDPAPLIHACESLQPDAPRPCIGASGKPAVNGNPHGNKPDLIHQTASKRLGRQSLMSEMRWIKTAAQQADRGPGQLTSHLAMAQHDPFARGQTFKADGSPDMQPVGRYANLRAQAILEAIGKARTSVPHDRR